MRDKTKRNMIKNNSFRERIQIAPIIEKMWKICLISCREKTCRSDEQ